MEKPFIVYLSCEGHQTQIVLVHQEEARRDYLVSCINSGRTCDSALSAAPNANTTAHGAVSNSAPPTH